MLNDMWRAKKEPFLAATFSSQFSDKVIKKSFLRHNSGGVEPRVAHIAYLLIIQDVKLIAFAVQRRVLRLPPRDIYHKQREREARGPPWSLS